MAVLKPGAFETTFSDSRTALVRSGG